MSTSTHARTTVQSQPVQQQQAGPLDASAEELQRFNEDAAAARHLTAIRIRGQLAEFNEGQAQG